MALDLDTRGGPAWKPLPVALTAPFSLLGDAAPYVWLVVARAGALLAVLMAARVAGRLSAPGGRLAAAAGAVAGAALLSISGFVRDSALGNSEGLLAALALLAIDRHLEGEHRRVLWLGFATALLRPETWPFLGIYAVWLWAHRPELRRPVLVAAAAVPLLWLGPELWGSGDALRSSSRAQILEPDSPANADQPAVEVIRSFGRLLIAPVAAAALLASGMAVGAAVRARRAGRALPAEVRAVLALVAGGAAWLLVVAAMAEAGYPGEPRYLVVAAAAAAVLAGVGAAELFKILRRALAALRPPSVRPRPRARHERGGGGRLGAASAVALAGALVIAAGLALPRAGNVDEVANGLEYDARLWDDLRRAIDRAGGRERLNACGHRYAQPRQVPMVAWELRRHGSEVGLHPQPPGVVFRSRLRAGAPLRPSPRDPRFRPLAAAGEWRIAAACPTASAASPAPVRTIFSRPWPPSHRARG